MSLSFDFTGCTVIVTGAAKGIGLALSEFLTCPAVGFVASEQAGYVTGVVLPVDGGLSI